MDLTTIETVLMAIAPSIASIITIIGSIINITLKIKKMQTESNDKLLKAETKLAKAYNDIAIIKAKCESLEKIISKEKK